MTATHVLYIDDSGTKEYETDPNRYNLHGRGNSRYFVLCGVLVTINQATKLSLEIRNLKIKHFGDDVVEIKSNWLRIPAEQQRRYCEPFGVDVESINNFTDEFYELIGKFDLMLIASVVDKLQLQENYQNPWYAPTVAYETLLMRVQAQLIAEDRLAIVIDDTTGKTPKGNDYRTNLERHHNKLKKHGSRLLQKMKFHSLGTQKFVNSAKSHIVQLADVCAYDVHMQFRLHGNDWENPDCERLDLYENFERIHTKFRNHEGQIQGWGIIKMPQKINRRWTILK
jgi:hypothetical protein